MAVQDNSTVTIAYKAETEFGVPPGATDAQYLRRVSSNLNAVKDTFTSQEVRSDAQIVDMRHGMRSARGPISGELSPITYDPFFLAAMRGAWVAGVSVAPADFATGVTIANNAFNGSQINFAGAGSLITKGFKVGDIVRATGLTNPLNNNINLRITNLSATSMGVFPRIVATAQQAAGWSIAVAGAKLTNGVVKRSFTIEQALPDATVWERFSGVRVGGFSLSAPPSGMTTVDFDLMGTSFNIGTAAPYFTSPATETTNGILSGVDGGLRLNGEEQGVVTAFQLQLTNNLSMAPVIGSTFAPNVFYGRTVVTGSVSAYLEDPDLVNAFINESEVDLVAVLEGSGADPQPFMSFNMQRVKFTGASKQLTGDGGVIAQFPFQALLKAGGTGSVFDQTTLSIQRAV